jgi:hypothetical protein
VDWHNRSAGRCAFAYREDSLIFWREKPGFMDSSGFDPLSVYDYFFGPGSAVFWDDGQAELRRLRLQRWQPYSRSFFSWTSAMALLMGWLRRPRPTPTGYPYEEFLDTTALLATARPMKSRSIARWTRMVPVYVNYPHGRVVREMRPVHGIPMKWDLGSYVLDSGEECPLLLGSIIDWVGSELRSRSGRPVLFTVAPEGAPDFFAHEADLSEPYAVGFVTSGSLYPWRRYYRHHDTHREPLSYDEPGTDLPAMHTSSLYDWMPRDSPAMMARTRHLNDLSLLPDLTPAQIAREDWYHTKYGHAYLYAPM